MSRIPRKTTRRFATASKAVATAVTAMADAGKRGAGVNLEASFPGGSLRIVCGQIKVTRTVSAAP